jgi:hypothetical protein
MVCPYKPGSGLIAFHPMLDLHVSGRLPAFDKIIQTPADGFSFDSLEAIAPS